MKNTMNYNDKNFQAATVAVMNDIFASDAAGTSMDDLYNTVCKYVKMTRKEFDEKYQQADAQIECWKNESANCELAEDDLDMVVGGSIGSFFSAIGEGLATAASAVGNFVKEHAVHAAMIAVLGLGMAALGAMVGVMFTGAVVAAFGLTAVNTAAAVCATAGAVVGGAVGTISGFQAEYGA